MLWGLFLVASGTGLLRVAFERSPRRRLRRRIARALGRLRRAVARAREPGAGRARALEATAGDYAEAWRRQRRAATPLEDLRPVGAQGVRLATLADAGYRSLADLDGVDRARLEAVPGLGEASADRVLAAAARLRAKIAEEPVELPGPDLDTPGAAPLANAALDVLEAEDVLGGAPAAAERLARALEAGEREVARRARFWPWLLRRAPDQDLDPATQEAAALERRAAAQMEGGLIEDLRERRARLKALPTTGRGPGALRDDFRARYAEATALIESVLPQVALVPGAGAPDAAGPLAGRLPAEIAAAVEAFPLRTDGLRVTLRRYQGFGARYLLHQRRTILGDEMGLGKTIEALAAMVHRREVEGATHFLVVAPASITGSWEREIGRRTDLVPHVLHGPDKAEDVEAWLAGGGVAVVSYATLRAVDLPARLDDGGRRVDLLVADEAHYVKNPASGRSQAVQALLARADHVCLMTGTPMENHPAEFVGLVALVAPTTARALADGDLVQGGTVVEPAAFHRTVSPVYLRRNQRDVLRELPPKVDLEEWVDVGAEERGAYVEAVEGRNLMGMRRAVTLSGDAGPSAKVRRLLELLEEHRASGRKAIVFSWFLPVLEDLGARVPDVVGTITGAVPADQRMALVDRFQQAEGHAVLLAQIVAAGVGLNLQAASVVVLMEPQWKPSTEEQAIARAHRMGQTETVLVHRLLARDTVDERIVEILEGKLDLFERYARESLVKRASRQATETAYAELVLEAEAERLRRTG